MHTHAYMYMHVCTHVCTFLFGALPSVGPHWKSNSSPQPHPAVLPVSPLGGGGRGPCPRELWLWHLVTEEHPATPLH